MDNPLRPVVASWLKKIDVAMDYKKKHFSDAADEAMAFFDGPYDWLYGPTKGRKSGGLVLRDGAELPKTTFGMTVNKVAEMVQIYGPFLYHRNPVRKVSPRQAFATPPALLGDPADPRAQVQAQMAVQQSMMARQVDDARAGLLEAYLNATPTVLGLKDHCRMAVDEALIKGAGVLWCELYRPAAGGGLMAGSFYDSVDNLCVDPDGETVEAAKWVARRCVHPAWEVEREYGLEPGELKAKYESYERQAEAAADDDGGYKRAQGRTNDLVVYWKVFSKMGAGGRLQGLKSDELKQALEEFGDFVYLVLCEDVPYPLNLPPAVMDDQAAWSPGPDGSPPEVASRLEWPVPLWADDAWPFARVAFHEKPRCVWPIAHVKPALGELKFIQWAYSFVANKVRINCRDFLAVKKAAAEEIKVAVQSGADLTMLEVEGSLHGSVREAVEFLQHPPMNADVWKVVEAVERNFEKRVGLTELSYGMSAVQLRSAQEASLKADQLRVRPDDMAQKVEDAMSRAARNEAVCARWHLGGPDVQAVLGDQGAALWDRLVRSFDLAEIVHGLEYRVEAGSARKPNRERDANNMQQAVQVLLPVLQQYAGGTGDVGPLNNLISDWSKSMDMPPDRYLMRGMPPPPAPAPSGPPPKKGGPPR